MRQTIEKLLHIPCEEKNFTEQDALPLFLRGNYDLTVGRIAGVCFLCAAPKQKINLASMRKHRTKLVELTGMECTFLLEAMSAYTKDKMLQEGIPFILGDKELYLPFLGIVLNSSVQKEKAHPLRISFRTQKMLLTALYNGITNCSVTEMAKILETSKMSVTRCFDELEAFGLGLIQGNGTAGRYFVWSKSRKELWETVKPILRNPSEKEYLLDCMPPWPLPKSGLSAISYFSMLSDNPYPTYAISKQAVKDLHPERLPQVPEGEVPAAVIQVMGYSYLYENDSELVIDPLSAVLSLTAEDMSDPRVEGEVEKILEEFVYDERA